MHIEKTLEVDTEVASVWRLITDVEALASCFPGGKLVEQREDGTYRGEMAIELGPTTMVMSGSADFAVNEAERRLSITARGQDRRKSLRVSAEMAVVAREVEQKRTAIEVDGNVRLVGPLASAAETGAEQVVDDLADRFIACLGARSSGDALDPDHDRSTVSGLSLLRLFLRGVVARLRQRFGRSRKSSLDAHGRSDSIDKGNES